MSYRKKDYVDEIKQILINRSPNFVCEDVLIREIKNCDIKIFNSSIEKMEKETIVDIEEETPKSTQQSIRYIKLTDYTNILTKTHISFGGIRIPRQLQDTKQKYFPEQLNSIIELIAKQSESLENRFSEAVKDQQNKYWANVVGLLGFMVSVMALIIVALPQIQITTDIEQPFWNVVKINLSQILPLAIVLAIFVLVLRWVIRK